MGLLNRVFLLPAEEPTVEKPRRLFFRLRSESIKLAAAAAVASSCKMPAAAAAVETLPAASPTTNGKSSRDLRLRPAADTGDGGPLLHVELEDRRLGDGGPSRARFEATIRDEVEVVAASSTTAA